MATPQPPATLLVDTSAAIALLEDAGRADLFQLLVRADFHVGLPPAVWQELGNGPQARQLRQVVGVREFAAPAAQVERLSTRFPLLGKGEISVLAHASGPAANAVCVLDDKRARSAAAALGLAFTGTLGLLDALVAAGALTAEECSAIIQSLRASGFRLPAGL